MVYLFDEKKIIESLIGIPNFKSFKDGIEEGIDFFYPFVHRPAHRTCDI